MRQLEFNFTGMMFIRSSTISTPIFIEQKCYRLDLVSDWPLYKNIFFSENTVPAGTKPCTNECLNKILVFFTMLQNHGRP